MWTHVHMNTASLLTALREPPIQRDPGGDSRRDSEDK
jgi:hypothetical protein